MRGKRGLQIFYGFLEIGVRRAVDGREGKDTSCSFFDGMSNI